MASTWHLKGIEEILKELETNVSGLSSDEAKKRLKENGLNKLPEVRPDGYLKIFFKQFQSPLILVLFIAAIIILFLSEYTDAIFIFAILLFNAVVGTLQEGKAQNTLSALKRFSETKAYVLREEKEIIIPDLEIVVGDIIVFRQGDKIPADARIVKSNNLKIDEASLTGESVPVIKSTEALKKEKVEIVEQKNMVFKGTYVVSGIGQAVAVAVGKDTQIGKISQEIALIDTEIPLKKDIRGFSKIIIAIVAVASAILFFSGILAEKGVKEMFATVVSLSVSIIPEGLPIVLTLVLSTGVWRMAKHGALVKKLQAVEALGQANVLAIDKTGTITKNEMMVKKVYVAGKIFDILGNGYEPKGEVRFENQNIDPLSHLDLLLSARVAGYGADSNVVFDEKAGMWKTAGDPTEAALEIFAEKLGCHKNDLESEYPNVLERPFDYETKYHLVVRKVGNKHFLSVVGAPESVLSLCEKILENGKFLKMTPERKQKMEEIFLEFSRQGLRVLAFAYDKAVNMENLKVEKLPPLVFGGFFGIEDTIRENVQDAVASARGAGIKIVMITGDHKTTAKAIAKSAGIYSEGDEIITGEELNKLSEKELSEKLFKTTIFARVSPAEKFKIIQLFKKQGNIIAMTGDGVNDAPSLVAADLGVAMGKIGTEVAKEAADIVLLDDNFGTIIKAVEEGRHMYRTLKKVILYLFSTSAGEFLTIIGTVILGMPLPLLPAQIIWLNFVTDGFLDVSLAMEPKDGESIRKKAKKRGGFIDLLMAQRIFFMALPMAVGTLFLFNSYLGGDMVKAWTIALTLLAVFQWLNAWNCRSESKSIFQSNFFSNKFLLGATAIIVILQLFVVYHPFMNKILKTTPLSLKEWGAIILIAFSVIAVEELRKLACRFVKKHNY